MGYVFTVNRKVTIIVQSLVAVKIFLTLKSYKSDQVFNYYLYPFARLNEQKFFVL